MASGTLGTALSGLMAAQIGIRTTQHNISNINTAGFRRQEVGYAALLPDTYGLNYVGTGVSVSTVRNLYSQFQDSQLLLDQAQLSRNQAYASSATQVDTLAGDANTGLTSALDAFFEATQTVASDPTSNAARQVMLSAGRNLAGRFNTLANAFDQISSNTNREIAATVTRINTFASQIAQLSGNINRAEAGNGQLANDLRDQRDQLVSELNKLINVTPIQQSDGAFNLFVANGQPLVVGTSMTRMSVDADATTPEFDVPTLEFAGGYSISLDVSMVSGGTLGGLMAVREDVLEPAMRDLDRLALVFAERFNTQHVAGFDKQGGQGVEFFTSATILPKFLQPAALTDNLGNQAFSASISNFAELQASDYELSYDGINYTLTRLSDGASSPAAAIAVINGISQGFTLTPGVGTPQAGDRWLIRPSYGAAASIALNADIINDPNKSAADKIAASATIAGSPGDNRNAVWLADLQTLTTAINGTDSFFSAYAQLVSRSATLASEADINLSAYETLTNQSKASQQAISGVNLDEEAANLIRFQQAYQAAARAMQISTGLFEDLLGAVR